MADDFDGMDEFDSAGAAVGKKFPSMKQLGTGLTKKIKRVYAPGSDNELTVETAGRLVIFQPTAYDAKAQDNINGGTKPRMTVNAYVLDGPPIVAVEDKAGDVTYTPDEPWTPPFLLEDLYVSQSKLIEQLMKSYNKGGKALGRVGQIPTTRKGNDKPWVLLSGGLTAEEIALAKASFKALEPDAFE
jgi:hypothetical protein